jgi:hypothetical protein
MQQQAQLNAQIGHKKGANWFAAAKSGDILAAGGQLLKAFPKTKHHEKIIVDCRTDVHVA